jgi:hypothetical protein
MPEQRTEIVDVVTCDEVPGRKSVRCLGLVRGRSVGARNLARDIQAVFRMIVGGKVGVYAELLQASREEAIRAMVTEAEKVGAVQESLGRRVSEGCSCSCTPTVRPRTLTSSRLWRTPGSAPRRQSRRARGRSCRASSMLCGTRAEAAASVLWSRTRHVLNHTLVSHRMRAAPELALPPRCCRGCTMITWEESRLILSCSCRRTLRRHPWYTPVRFSLESRNCGQLHSVR